MHVWNLGIGGDLAASAIVALAQMKVFEGSNCPARLDAAYESFSTWCALNNKTANTKAFEKKTFKMKSLLCGILVDCSYACSVSSVEIFFKVFDRK